MEKKISKAEEKKLLEIAMKNSPVIEDRRSLETAHSDSEDFLDIAVWEVRAMLEQAYLLGKASK